MPGMILRNLPCACLMGWVLLFFLLFIYFIFFALATLFRVIYSARYSRSWNGGVFFVLFARARIGPLHSGKLIN